MPDKLGMEGASVILVMQEAETWGSEDFLLLVYPGFSETLS